MRFFLIYLSPRLLIPKRVVLPPVEHCLGVNPHQAANSLPFLKTWGLPTACGNHKNRSGICFVNFIPAVSSSAKKAINTKIRDLNIRMRSDKTLFEIAEYCNPLIRGWMNYYGRFYKSGLYYNFHLLNGALINWTRRTLKSLGKSYWKAQQWLKRFAKENPNFFAHWIWVPPSGLEK